MSLLPLFEKYYSPNTSCLLESVSRHEKTGRYSIIAAHPEFIFRSWGKTIQINNRPAFSGNPLDELKKIFESRKIKYDPSFPPFTGGAVGYIGYDSVRLWETIGDRAEKDINIPDIYLLFYDNVIVFDHFGNKIYKFGANKKSGYRFSEEEYVAGKMHPSMSKEVFCEMVLKAKEYIAAGDIYQVNLSQRISMDIECDGWQMYKRLRQINPSPFAGFMDLDGIQIIGCSPERLVKVTGNIIETRPIAGTFPRGKNEEEDRELSEQLVLHPKERAEHIMLVDLERNDLGRVSRYGSVKVDEMMTVESYSHVHHIVSNVTGIVEKGIDQIDILKAVFPGGTITGCPKIRCIQIIEELEPVRRNLYTGCMGWIGYNGNMDLNIIIRTIVKIGGKIYIQTGAGIVADSIPEREYNETLYKARAMVEAVMGQQQTDLKC